MRTLQQCPPEPVLERLAAGTAPREELRDLVAHLLRGCPACVARLRELLRRPVPEGSYDLALDRFEEGLRAALQAPAGPVSRLWSVVQDGGLPGPAGAGEAATPPPAGEPAPQPPLPCRIPLTVSERRSRSMGPSFK